MSVVQVLVGVVIPSLFGGLFFRLARNPTRGHVSTAWHQVRKAWHQAHTARRQKRLARPERGDPVNWEVDEAKREGSH